jgi:glycerol-3-phosphate dehydrogenase
VTRIGVAGAGAWGIALAHAAQRAGSTPVIWSRRGASTDGDFAISGDDEVLADVKRWRRSRPGWNPISLRICR